MDIPSKIEKKGEVYEEKEVYLRTLCTVIIFLL